MRGVQGVGAAIVLPAALSIVMNMFDGGRRAQQGARASGARIGAAGRRSALIAGGLLTRYLGWEWIFFLNVPVGAAVLLLTPRFVRESRLGTPPPRSTRWAPSP